MLPWRETGLLDYWISGLLDCRFVSREGCAIVNPIILSSGLLLFKRNGFTYSRIAMGTEAELLTRCRRGEAAAWDELFDLHYAAALRFVFQLGSDFSAEDAEEICQEVFLSVIRHLESFHGESRFQTWLFRIAANKARDFREHRIAAKRGGGKTPLSLQAEDPETGLTLDPPASTGDLAGPPLLDEDWLVLSTIHSAKGCEWDEVHVIHATDGSIPSDMATGDDEQIEEERRLLYVALTRARDGLFVHVPLRYHLGQRPLSDRHAYAQVSRFLPEAVRAHFDERTTYMDDGRAIGDGAAPANGGGAQVDAFLAGLWNE